jgi:hypothetical protein
MRFLMALFTCAILVLSLQQATAADRIFEGQWHTTNRKLDGTMRCVVTDLGNENWQGRFVGTWQGVPFDYTVKFSGPPSHLHGTANIDGADYSWTGVIETGEMSGDSHGFFKATFTGNRYLGNFDLKEQPR